MQYLGHMLDAQTLHFEHENCPTCSVEKNRGGKLKRGKYNWREDPDIQMLVIPIYDEYKREIIYLQMLRSNFSSDNEFMKQLDKIGYLFCSRWPECKHLVTLNKSVLLDDPSLLIDAQHAYRTS